MSVSSEAQSIVFCLARLQMEPGDNIKSQKTHVYSVLRCSAWGNGKVGYARVDEAWAGRAKAPTYRKLLERAAELGLVRFRIELLVDRMNRTDAEFFAPQVDAIEMIGGGRR